MDTHTYGDSEAALYLADILATESKHVRRKASSSMSSFNRMMNAISIMPDKEVRMQLIQLIPNQSPREHPELVNSLISNLRHARKSTELKAAMSV